MNLANVIKRKGREERVLDEVTSRLKQMLERHLAPLEGMPYNASLIERLERASEEIQREFQAQPFFSPMERVVVDIDVNSNNDLRQEMNVAASFIPSALPMPGVYTRFN